MKLLASQVSLAQGWNFCRDLSSSFSLESKLLFDGLNGCPLFALKVLPEFGNACLSGLHRRQDLHLHNFLMVHSLIHSIRKSCAMLRANFSKC